MGCGPSKSKEKKKEADSEKEDVINFQNFIRENKNDPR